MGQRAAGSSCRKPMNDALSTDLERPVVSTRFVSTARAVAEAVFSTDAGPPPADRIDWLCTELDDFLSKSGARTRFVIRLALSTVSLSAPLLAGRIPPLRRLSLGERVRALTLLERSPLGAPVLAVKALLCVLYYEHPDAAREIGFDAECLGASTP
jgi:hypothetical protein